MVDLALRSLVNLGSPFIAWLLCAIAHDSIGEFEADVLHYEIF